MKKILKRFLLIFCAVVIGILPATGCKPENIIRGEKTINIRAYSGGYGNSWLTALADKFNEVYAEQGYVANVLPGSNDLDSKVAMKELSSRDDWVDLYFVNVSNTMSGFTAKGGEYGQLVADLTNEVWEKPAINFNGEEESGTVISEKMAFHIPDEVLKVDDKVYGFTTSNDIGGMIVNMEKLAKYGISEIPRTTKEFFSVFELIYMGDASRNIKGSLETNLYPVTYLGGANGYPLHFVTAWHAQYAGVKEYSQFYGYIDADGNEMREDGYTVYESEALLKMLEATFNMYDSSFIAKGSSDNTIDVAHTKIMSDKGGAVFMADGNWAYNEIIVNYSSKIESLAFANIPVLSAVGVKLFGSETPYKFGEDKCEELLSYIIGKTDEGKTAEEIVALVSAKKGLSLNINDVIEIMKARGIYCSRSSLAAGAFVAEKSKVKDICYLFLRMFASDDNATLYNQECNGFTAYMNDFSYAKSNTYNEQCREILEASYSYPVWVNATDLRLKVGHNNLVLPNDDLSFVSSVIQKGITIYKDGAKIDTERKYNINADAMLTVAQNYAREKWAKWISDISK